MRYTIITLIVIAILVPSTVFGGSFYCNDPKNNRLCCSLMPPISTGCEQARRSFFGECSSYIAAMILQKTDDGKITFIQNPRNIKCEKVVKKYAWCITSKIPLVLECGT